jgi:hypothetical protein
VDIGKEDSTHAAVVGVTFAASSADTAKLGGLQLGSRFL